MTVSIKKMITHFINPENTEFTVCGLWTFKDSLDEIQASDNHKDITCKNCIKTTIFILVKRDLRVKALAPYFKAAITSTKRTVHA